MKLQLSILVRGFIASVVSLSTWAQPETTHVRLGSGSETHEFNRIRVENVQEESLGRIRDPSIDPISADRPIQRSSRRSRDFAIEWRVDRTASTIM